MAKFYPNQRIINDEKIPREILNLIFGLRDHGHIYYYISYQKKIKPFEGGVLGTIKKKRGEL